MPPAVAWVAAVAGKVAFTVGTVAVTWGAIAKVALVGASMAYSAGQQRKMQKALRQGAASVDQGRKLMVRDPVAPRRVIYGKVPVAGPIVYMAVSGSQNEYLHMVLALASHECEELGEIRFGDTVVPFSGADATGAYAGFVRIKKFVGIAAGERDTDLESESGGDWTANHLGKGVARLHVRLKHNPDLFPEGIPLITCLVKGKKVYDPRTTTTAWSANAALCVADFLSNEQFGKGVAFGRIRSAELIEAANICDEAVELEDESTEARYEINGTIESGDPEGALLEMVDAMQGHICDAGGLWTIRAGAHRSAVLDLTDDDLLSELNVSPRLSRQDTFNGVRGTFISPVNQWAAADFPRIKNDTYMAWDGDVRLWKDVSYNFTTSPAMAQRLAKIELERGRQQIVVNSRWGLKALKCQPGDTVRLTNAALGWADKEFTVVDWAFDVVGEDLGIEMTLRETAAGVWDWANGEETAVDLAPNTNLYNPRSVETPSGLTLTTENFTQPNLSFSPRLKVAWNLPADGRILNGGYVHIEYKRSASSTWLIWTTTLRGDANEDFITDVLGGQEYNVRVRFQNDSRVRGAYASQTATVTDDSTTIGGGGGAGVSVASATGVAAINGSSPGTEIVALTVTTSTARVIAKFTVHRTSANAGTLSTDVHLYRDGTSIRSVSVLSTSPPETINPAELEITDSPGAGTYTYRIRCGGDGAGNPLDNDFNLDGEITIIG
jgi:hypothetical protein